MKVAIVSQADAGGGAGLAAARLHGGLRKIGVQSQMLVSARSDQSGEFTHVLPKGDFVTSMGNRLLQAVLPRVGLNNLTSLQSFRYDSHPHFATADVVNFHNLHGGYFNYLALPKLTRSKPAVLTLHDMWAFTGHCIYSYDCERWKTGCGSCPYPETYPAIRRDATRFERSLKKWAFSGSRLSIIVLCRWMEQAVQESILRHHSIHHIPNGLDLEVFRPLDRGQSRRLLGLPADRNLILFAAADLDDRRKGGDLLIQALAGFPEELKRKTSLVVMGKANKSALGDLGMESFPLGFIQDEQVKAQIFSAADIFAFPTRADNLPLVVQESMACGTPIVSFEVGGLSDLVRPGLTGLLAPPGDADEFRRHLEYLLADRPFRQRLGHSCRDVAEREYSVSLQAQRYREIFQRLLKA